MGQEPAQPGWAQMAECLAQGGQWTGTECLMLGQPTIAERACVAAGGQWDVATSQCSVPIVTPAQPPPEKPQAGLSATGWVLIGAAVVGAAQLLRRGR
jgi:hypothetical protein